MTTLALSGVSMLTYNGTVMLKRLLLQVIILCAVVNPASAAVRFFYPSAPLSLSLEKEMEALLSEYNQLHPAATVEWVKKGEDFSSLRELMAASLAQALPDLATIEWSETASFAKTGIARAQDAKPFQKSAPALIVDQEMVFRAYADPLKLPKTWEELLALTEKTGGLALPLHGARGLWLFEALTRLNPPTMKLLLALSGNSKPVQTRLTREQAIRAFIERNTPL
jgi:ABC-type glycerol-3-phosphate transport system substrate-binding protein